MESRGSRWLGVSCVSRRRRRLGILSAVTLTGLLACAASSRASLAASGSEPSAADVEARRGKDRLDREETADIRGAVTDPSHLNAWVDHVPEGGKVPSPGDFLGYAVGTPGMLTPPDTIVAYMRALAKASPSVRVLEMGRSHQGREMIAVAVGKPANLRKLDDIAAANAALADPRVTDRERAEELVKKTPLLYYMTAGLHSPETGPPEMVMELAYRLAVSKQPHIREIRDDVVVLISPVLEMDGRARMVDWWRRHLQDVTELEDSPPRMAPFWGDYTAHDNNRDGLQLTQPLTRNYVDFYHRYHPIVSLDLHESVPLLYVSTGTGPYNESIDPITVTEWQAFSSHEVSEATRLGLRGVWTWGFYTGWYPGYLLWVTNNHNAVGRFYETFGNSNPGTFTRDLRRSRFADRRVNERAWYRAWPPPKELRWSLRDNTNYMQTGALASLRYAARNRKELLMNFWQKGHNAIEAGKTRGVRGFVIPAAQRDAGGLARILELLADHRIEVHRANAEASLGDVKVEPGDFVVRMDQPYRNFAWTLLQPQPFPKDAAHTPYDDVAWALGHMLGVEVRAVNDPDILALEMELADGSSVPEGTVSGDGPWRVEHLGQAELMTLAYRLQGAKLTALAGPVGETAAGSLIIDGIDSSALNAALEGLHLDASAASAEEVAAATIPVKPARVGLFHTWRYTQDSGWARFSLEKLGVPFTLIDKDDLRAGDLAQRFDVILVPSQGGMSFANMVHGVDTRWGPLAYTQTPEYPSHGVIDSSPDITGGMGFEGLANLQRFVESGGVMMTLGSAGKLAVEGGITRRVAVKSAGHPGSHLTVKAIRPEHPMSFGLQDVDHVFRGNFPIYDVSEYDRGMTVVQYGTKTWAQSEKAADAKAGIRSESDQPAETSSADPNPGTDATDAAGETAGNDRSKKAPLVLSGIVKKPDRVERAPAVLDVPVGQGHVLLLSFNPLHRHQNEHDFSFVGNALMFWDALPPPLPRAEMRRR